MSDDPTARVTTFHRVAGVNINPASITQDSASFAAIVSGLGALTLLLHRDDSGLHGYLVSAESGSAFKAAGLLANAIGAQAVESIIPESLSEVAATGWLEAIRESAVSSETQQGIDPTALVRTLAISMSEGDWIAISFRKPRKNEAKRYGKWLSHRFGGVAKPIHHSTGQNAVVCSIFAGGDSATDVRDLLNNVAGALPGFDLQVRARVASRFAASLPLILAGTGWVLLSLLGWPALTNLLPVLAVVSGWMLALPGLGAVGFGVARWLGMAKTMWSRLADSTHTGLFPAPAQRSRGPKKPRKERNGEKPRAAFEGEYPLAPSAFFVGPQVIVGLVAPHAGAQSGTLTTNARSVPPVLLSDIGPWIGSTAEGKVHLSAADMWGGMTIFGQPGSGKSVMTRSLFGWCCLERVAPSGRPGYPGRNNALIAFESKGEGTHHYQAWVEAAGDVTVQIAMADPNSFAIDLFDSGGTVMDRANFFTNAMKYAFDDGDIRGLSFDSLVRVFTAALACYPELVATVPGLDPQSSPVHLAYVLLGGAGDEMGVALASEIHLESIRMQSAGAPQYDSNSASSVKAANATITRMNDLLMADQQLGTLYQGVTPAARRNFVEAPRNKVSALNKMDSWWAPQRRKVTWQQILEGHRSVIVNTGTASGVTVEDQLSKQMSSLLMFSLKHAITRHCDGWQAQNRFVTIFSDELSLLSGSSSDVLTFLRDQGRSYGVRPIFATQRSEKLPPDVRRSVMTMTTFVSFTQADLQTSEEVAQSVSSHSGDWNASDILHLERFHAVVRTSVDQVRQSSFIAKMENFEADRHGFATLQGYAAGPPVPQVPAAIPGIQPPVVHTELEQLSLFPEAPFLAQPEPSFQQPTYADLTPDPQPEPVVPNPVNASAEAPASIFINPDGTVGIGVAPSTDDDDEDLYRGILR